jgi:hypothetical protein
MLLFLNSTKLVLAAGPGLMRRTLYYAGVSGELCVSILDSVVKNTDSGVE